MKSVRLKKKCCHLRKKEQKIKNNRLQKVTHKNTLLYVRYIYIYIQKTDQKRLTQKQKQAYIHKSQKNLKGR